ncbi:MAG: ASKHA domain-containing protein [Actinomycetota bacterium]
MQRLPARATDRAAAAVVAHGSKAADVGGRHRVVFAPSGVSVEVERGTTVLDAARAAGADLDSTCGGRGICGRCQIVPTIGTFAKHQITSDADAVSPWTSTEEDYSGRRALVDGHRLGCAACIEGDVVVEIPAASQVHRPVVRKAVDLGDLEIDPVVTLHYLELPTAELGVEVGGLAEQISVALAGDFGVTIDGVAARLLPRLEPTVISGDGAITVAVRDVDERRLVDAVWPGFVDRAVGAAFDVGSTTVAGHLVDLTSGEILSTAGRMNPQIRFGDDLMSRVSYVMMNPGGEVELTSAVRTALDELVGELLDEANATNTSADADATPELGRDRLLDVVIVGNPIMHHLVLGIDPTPLGQAPFRLATDRPVDTTAAALDLDLPDARVHLLPCIAGHVGADTAAAVLAEGPHRAAEVQLLVDVGTNAEIVLGSADGLVAASSPTGPAFEGAQISAGMRATAGAIERVRIDRDTLEPRVRVIGADHWSDEPEFVVESMKLDIAGVCGSGIIEAIGELYLAGVIATDGTIVARPTANPSTDRIVATGETFAYVLHRDEASDDEIRITQDDVRAIQLAKAALRAGIDLLTEAAGIDVGRVESVRLAGAFGAHIDPLYAKVLGLVPDVAVDRVRAVGNAAGAGAVRALLSGGQRREIDQAAAAITKIETALEPRFQELFVDAMGFPHSSVATPNLAMETALPAPTASATTAGPRGRRGGARGRRART